ncbi:MAG TPA: hypothetical protein VFD82_16080 [Planctomycetota bacterium]|nr:hypothetical protein [Planctomycetota bacterium]
MSLAPFPLLVALAATPAAQDPPSQSPDPVSLVAKAERLVAGKEEVEDAALLLWQALEILAAKPQNPMRDATAMTARYLLNEHDPLEKERRRVYASIAKQQVELAQSYRSRKWFEAAATRLDVAMRFDVDATTKERALLEAARPKPKAEAAPEKKEEQPKAGALLQRANTVRVMGAWREADGRISSPAHSGNEPLFEWETNAVHENHEIVVEWKPADPKQSHNLAIACGFDTDIDDRYQVQCYLHTESKQYALVILRVENGEYRKLVEVWQKATVPADGVHRIAIQIHDKQLLARLDDNPAVEALAAEPVRGRVGLLVGMNRTASCPIEFRAFRIDPLPADAPTDDELRERAAAEVQQSVTGFVDEAKALIAKKQPEQAAELLREALRELRKLPAGVLRTNLAATIEQMLTQTDSLAPKRKKTAQAIAAELVGLADKYAAAGKARLAFVLAEDAANFDPDGQAPRLAAAREAVQKWNSDQARARASELAPPADDGTVLREWFAEGKLLHGGSSAWQIEGPCARVPALAPDGCTGWMPKAGTPALTKARVFAHLPPHAAAGFCFDVAGPHDHSVAILDRQGPGLALSAYRFAGQKWMQLGRKKIPLDAWRLDGWFQIDIEATATGLTVRSAGAELVLDRKMLGNANGRFGFFATNADKTAATVELRAFQVPP